MSTATTAPDLSIVLPCFNEGPVISTSLASLDAWFGDIRREIIVVDDGSADDTYERAAAYGRRHSHVTVHRLRRNSGKGAAVRAAIPLVRGRRVVLLDADLAYDAAGVRAALAALEWADIAAGNRRHHESRYSVPVRLFGFLYRRHVVGLAFNAFVRFVLRIDSRDTQCGLKAFRREALDTISRSLTTSGFGFDIEMLLIARAHGLTVVDVPVLVTYHSSKSSIRLVRAGAAMVWQVLFIAARRAAGQYRHPDPPTGASAR